MTNQEAIEVIKDIYNYTKWDTYTTNDARTMAIKALTAIDNIRQEIRKLSNANPSYWHTCDVIEREEVLDIIDKYIKEGD